MLERCDATETPKQFPALSDNPFMTAAREGVLSAAP